MEDAKIYRLEYKRSLRPNSGPNQHSPRVLLVAMPWANPEYPSLALGLLKSLLVRDGISCDNLYGNQIFLSYLDNWPLYRHLSYAAEGDVVFTPHYFGSAIEDAARAVHGRTGQYYQPLHNLEACADLIHGAGSFIESLFESINWEEYDVVGFSLMFQQLLSSLCLSKLIKQHYPSIRILFGGPSCDDCMGLEMIRSFPEIDYVAIGEVDTTICQLVREIHARPGQTEVSITTPGVAYRNRTGEVCFSGRVGMTSHLDDLPYPDYGPYFHQFEKLGLDGVIEPVLYMEASRGCWWGQKSVCSFCGLNGNTIEFRSKSTERVVAEMKALAGRYQISRFWTSDNILDHRAYKTLLPALKQMRLTEGLDLRFFFEIKSNVTKEQVKALRDGGITWVQPGIESFSDHVLSLMHKGCDGLQQIQLLKFLAELSMDVDWNILYSNPNETPEDYYQMVEMMPFVHHLPPPAPGTVIQMNLQRFTRYFTDPDAHGITGVRPGDFYKQVFPRDDIDLNRLVYFFEYDHPDQQNEELAAAHQAFFAAIEDWRNAYQPGSLIYKRGPGYIEIVDRREAEGEQVKESKLYLNGVKAEIYLYCDSAQSFQQILRRFDGQIDKATLTTFLSQLVTRRLILSGTKGRFLSLAFQDQTGRGLQMEDAVATALQFSLLPQVENISRSGTTT